MACFLVPVAEAVITTVATKIIKKYEKKREACGLTENGGFEKTDKINFSRKLGWLSKLLWGGSALLIFEHIWHGEIVPFFPFLTNAANPQDLALMLKEMVSVGGTMSVFLTGIWAAMLIVCDNLLKRDNSNDLAVDRR